MKKKIKNHFVDSDIVYWMGQYMPKKKAERLMRFITTRSPYRSKRSKVLQVYFDLARYYGSGITSVTWDKK